MRIFLMGLVLLGLVGCRGVSTDGIPVVENFAPGRYLGTWHEVARLPHSFEAGLVDVTAEYSWKRNGQIRVINRGVDAESGKVKQIEGSAELKKGAGRGELLVTFFWPFAGDYRIIALDENYTYAMVTSDTTDYLWILAREKPMDREKLQELVDLAESYGFRTEELIFL